MVVWLLIIEFIVKIEDKVFWYKAKEVPDFKWVQKDLKVIMKNFTMKIGIKKYQFLIHLMQLKRNEINIKLIVEKIKKKIK